MRGELAFNQETLGRIVRLLAALRGMKTDGSYRGGRRSETQRSCSESTEEECGDGTRHGAAGQLGVVQPPQPCPSLWMCQAVATATLVRGDARVSGSSEERG